MNLSDFINEVAENMHHSRHDFVNGCIRIFDRDGLLSIAYRADAHTRQDIKNKHIELTTNPNLIKQRHKAL